MTHLDVSDADVKAASDAFLETIEEAIPKSAARR